MPLYWRARQQSAARPRQTPQAVAEVEYADLHDAEQECALFLRSTAGQPQQFTERFMTAAAPGIIATAMGNAYYDSHERYVFAIAKQMQKEYELIHAKGFILQLDCPDLAMERAMLFQDAPLAAFSGGGGDAYSRIECGYRQYPSRPCAPARLLGKF